MFEMLDDRSKRVIQLRYGLLDGKPKNLHEVALIYGITPEKVSRIENEALEKSGLDPCDLYLQCSSRFR